MSLRGLYDLWDGRSTPEPVRFADDPETPETEKIFTVRKRETNEEADKNERLNDLSKKLGDALAERGWIAMYLQHIATRLTILDTAELELQEDIPAPAEIWKGIKHSLLDQEASFECHVHILERRLRDSELGRVSSISALDHLVDFLASAILDPPQDHDIAFRYFSDPSHTQFSKDRSDFRCSNWRHFQLGKPLRRDDAKKHIEDTAKTSNFISISSSPSRLWDQVESRYFDGKTKNSLRVAVIDLRVLQRLGIAYASTTDGLEFRTHNSNNDTGVKYATKHQVLVLGWIPRRAIFGSLSLEQFKDLMQKSQMNVTSKEWSARNDENKKLSFEETIASLCERGMLPWYRALRKVKQSQAKTSS